jgi:hypothetical protein
MARRFTDTEKWRDEWWGSLPNDYRMIWLYLVDSCSIAGIWKKDFRGLNFNCNTKITEKEFLDVFGTRVIDRGNFFFIPKFIRFQCPKGLSSNKPAVVSIVKELTENNLIQIVSELFGNDYLIIKGKGKGKDKGKGEGKGMVKTNPDDPDFEDYENWIVDILNMNDYMFHDKIKNVGIQVNGHLKEYTTSYIGLLAEYPNKKPPDQNRFRLGLIKHIQDEQKKQSNGNRTTSKRTSSTISAQIGGTDYDNQQL